MESREIKMRKKYFFILLVLFIIGFTTGCTKQAESEDQNSVNKLSKIESTEEKKIEEQEIINETQLLPEFDKSNMESFYPKLDLLAYFPCNFSREYDEEYLAFYNDPSQIHTYSAPLDVDCVAVIFVDNDNHIQLNDLKLVTIGYDEKILDSIMKDSDKYGSWNGFCYLTDIDSNNFDELYFYELTGMSFGLVIMQYLNNEFKMVEYIDY